MIKLKSVSRQEKDKYVITVEDTEQPLEGGYKQYSIMYNPATGKEHLKKKIEEILASEKSSLGFESQIEADIKVTVESIGLEVK